MSNCVRLVLTKKVVLSQYLLIFLTACVANTVGSVDVENHLNSVVGRKYDPSIGWGKGWNKISEDDKSLELEFVRLSGCSYAIKIRKDTSSVESWRFTSPRSKCEDNYAPIL